MPRIVTHVCKIDLKNEFMVIIFVLVKPDLYKANCLLSAPRVIGPILLADTGILFAC